MLFPVCFCVKNAQKMSDNCFPNLVYCTTPLREILLKMRKFTIFPDCVRFALFVFLRLGFMLHRGAQALEHMERLCAKLQRTFGIRAQRTEDFPAHLLG